MTLPSIRFQDVRQWCAEALPFWADRGFDAERGVFREQLTLDGRVADPDFRRVRVIARQIYVFSHAHVLSLYDGLELAERSWDYLLRHAWQGAAGGWARRLGRDGDVLDATPDLYDIAFVMFALSWLIRAGGGVDAHTRLEETLDFVRTHMRPADGLGYLEAFDANRAVREQNPHMHMAEAMIAASQATGDARYQEAAAELTDLFTTRIFDAKREALREFFAPGWMRLEGPRGRLTEPGHQMEWAWILTQYETLSDDDLGATIEALAGSAERRGVDPVTGLTYDGVDEDGAVTQPTFRCWPQTEALKAQLALFERGAAPDAARISAIVSNLLDRYLETQPRGIWTDQLDAGARPVSVFTPASTLYHVFLAFSELMRLEPALRNAVRAQT